MGKPRLCLRKMQRAKRRTDTEAGRDEADLQARATQMQSHVDRQAGESEVSKLEDISGYGILVSRLEIKKKSQNN